MNILVLSDLHIDTCDNFGTFQWDEMDLIMQIEGFRDIHNIKKVIFNGDIFELLKYRYDDIRKANPILMRYFSDNDFIFIKGNHDVMAEDGTDHYQITNSSGQIIHIEHGHNADWFNGSRLGSVHRKNRIIITEEDVTFKILMDSISK